VEQSLYKLKTKEVEVAKMDFILIVVETINTLGAESPVFEAH